MKKPEINAQALEFANQYHDYIEAACDDGDYLYVLFDRAMLAGARAMQDAAWCECQLVPELRQSFTTDKNKAIGINHAATLCSTRIRELNPEDVIKGK